MDLKDITRSLGQVINIILFNSNINFELNNILIYYIIFSIKDLYSP